MANYISLEKNKLVVRVPYSRENVNFCRNIPDSKKWNAANKAWVAPPSRNNIMYLCQHFPNTKWVGEAQGLMFAVIMDWKQRENHDKEIENRLATPIEDFEFTTDPYEHQISALQLSHDKENFALFMEMGTGKTKVIIDNAEMLYQKGEIDTVVVICPNSIKSVWENEIKVHGPDVDRTVVTYHSQTFKHHQRDLARAASKKPMVWFIINVEALSYQKGLQMIQLACSQRNGVLMVVDESTRIKTDGASRTKNTIKAGKLAKYRRILTGTPITQSPLDLFAQMKFLSKDILGYSSKYAYRNRFSVTQPFNAVKKDKKTGEEKRVQIQLVKDYRNLDELHEILKPHSYRVRKEDCLDLPEKIYVRRYVNLSDEQQTLYNIMKEEMVISFGDVDLVTAPIVLTQMMRLQQIIGGYVSH